jgi:hypothetical protein
MRRALVVLALLGGCSDEEGRPASWPYISVTIIQPNCATAGCHSSLAGAAGLELDRVSSWDELVGQDQPLVVPGDPDASQLMWRLRGEGVGVRMPPDDPLPAEDLELIERWILEGAARE